MGTDENGAGLRIDHEGLSAVARRISLDGDDMHGALKPVHDRLLNARKDTATGWSSAWMNGLGSGIIDMHTKAMGDASEFLTSSNADFENIGSAARNLLSSIGDADDLNGSDIERVREVTGFPLPSTQDSTGRTV